MESAYTAMKRGPTFARWLLTVAAVVVDMGFLVVEY
jgi:hypothetical protein